jgi:predicted ATPase
MEKNKKNIRIEKLTIENYRGIDHLELDFIQPQMIGEPDITVLGSRNGIGKTSVLECCVWLVMALGGKRDLNRRFAAPYDTGSLVRAGHQQARISGKIHIGNKLNCVSVTILSSGTIKNVIKNQTTITELDVSDNNVIDWCSIMNGKSSNPLVANRFIFLHSYRKIQEGNPELGMMVNNESSTLQRDKGNMISTFKKMILTSLMSSRDLFENTSENKDVDTEKFINTLNDILMDYANVKIGKLKPLPDNTIDIRVECLSSGNTFSFDGLSSGQKEIVSTLFMIWSNTLNKPSVVLIDEPELHLNTEWHRNFINKLSDIAPDNQYIMATHSEDIMSSVAKEQRILLLDS